jgi:hypothetical protein
MGTLFPFGFPWPTAAYLALFVLTAAVYTAFAQYVLAGSIVVLAGYVVALVRTRGNAGSVRVVPSASGLGLIQKIARDWLPAVLGLTLAAAIAPFVLLQVLYQREFSAASQILFVRALLAVLALMMAFWLLYLQKSQGLAAPRLAAQAAVALSVCACLLFTAWAWSGIHVLGLHEAQWQSHSHSRRWIYSDAEVWPRLGYWITASFTTLAVALAWQLHGGRRLHPQADLDLASRRLKALALLGIVTSAAEAWLWQLWVEPSARAVVLSVLALPYGLLVFAGMGIQTAGWLSIQTGAQLTTRRLTLISAGAALTIPASLVVREARRLAAIDVTRLFEVHRQATQSPGVGLFLTCLAANAAIIAACVLIVRRALRALQ